MLSFQGFIDIHTHGIGKYDTRTENPEHIAQIAIRHAQRGTAAILPTIYPDAIVGMRRNMEAVRKAMVLQASREDGSARVLGVHLEGPFLNPARCGALEKGAFLKPTLSLLRKLIEGYEDIIRIITIAPEIPGALRVIEKCSALGMKVNMGHSDATFTQAVDGKKAGASGITHLFNAMRPFHHREPGLAGLGLIDEDLYTEVIADGIHLHPMALELIFSRKRIDRIILVSDSVKGGRTAKGVVYNKEGILAGSVTTIAGFVKRLRAVGIPDAEIVEASTDNPARYLGLH